MVMLVMLIAVAASRRGRERDAASERRHTRGFRAESLVFVVLWSW